jgi:hypothetical protein
LPKLSGRKLFVGGLFFFAFWLYVVLPFLYSVPRYSHDETPNKCSVEEGKNHGFWEKASCDPTAYFTLWLVAFTGVLALSTIGLSAVTARGVRTQTADTRILQRAYISVEPGGICLRIDGSSIMGHIAIRNAGHLPARDLSWFVNIKWSANGSDDDFPLSDGRGSVVITPGTATTRGSGSSIVLQDLLVGCNADGEANRHLQAPVYIYVWGAIDYNDGFSGGRVTKFCHRYNWMMRGKYDVDVRYARLHEFGNDST